MEGYFVANLIYSPPQYCPGTAQHNPEQGQNHYYVYIEEALYQAG